MADMTSQQELLDKHLQLVIEANKHTNITRIVDVEQGRLLHVEDSLAGLPEFQAAPSGLAADLGTGGGYPGIPLSVMTGRPIDLVESVGKKARVLESIVEQLGLRDSVTVRNERAEELALERPNAYSVVVARALAALPSLVELASPLLHIGGQLIAYKSQDYADELEHAKRIEHKVGMKPISTRDFALSDSETHRSIIVFEKVSEPTVKLPRRPGMAQKNPYKR